jgi:tetratricopeptide (TPR) repeat protein
MTTNRWDSLDFEPHPRSGSRKDGGTGKRERGSTGPDPQQPTPDSSPLPPEVVQAQSAYVLRNYPLVIELLEPRLLDFPGLPGGQRTLGFALARLNREEEARERLREAARQSSADWAARASLASLLLRIHSEANFPPPLRAASSSPAAEAVAHLEEAVAQGPPPAARELLGAAHWSCGRDALASRRDREAARQFAAAAEQFQEAAELSGVARRALPARQAAAYVGQAVALLLADEPDAAQRLFSRTPRANVESSDAIVRFAAGLYELCEELRHLPVPDRAEAADALREVVLQTRLVVGFYDARQAVNLAWHGGTP